MREAPRPHDNNDYNQLDTIKERQDSLYRLFFLTCLRASTHHETATDFIDPEIFGDIIYENFVFDIARIMDICAIYGQSGDTVQLVIKMVGNIFARQPKYINDLYTAVPTFLQVMLTGVFIFLTNCVASKIIGMFKNAI